MTFRLVPIIALCGCSISAPITGNLSTGEPISGMATGSISGEGTVEVQAKHVTCNGSYNPLSEAEILTVPLNCSDGATGLAQVTRDPSRTSGKGDFELSNGMTGNFEFAVE